jgi:hypothetical protein
MATAAANPLLRFEDSNGDPLSGGTLEFYESGSSTPKTAYGDSSESTSFTTKTLDSRGEAVVYFGSGNYKLVVKDSGGSTIKTLDPIIGAITATASASEWGSSGDTPTYVSATSFTVPGDKTASYEVGRRIKTTNTAGTAYSVITASSYSAPNTTVTVENVSGSLDNGLSSVEIGLITATNTSLPVFSRATSPGNRLVPHKNLVVARASASTITVTADEIELYSASGNFKKVSSVNVTIDITASGANGLDTGVEANSTWYYVWIVSNGTTTAGILSTSSSAPTLPSGYIYKGLVSSVYNNGSGNLRDYRQIGNDIESRELWVVLTSGTQTTLTAIDLSAHVPPIHGAVSFRTSVVSPASAGTYNITIYSSNATNSRERIITLSFTTGAAVTASGNGRFIPEIAQTVYYAVSSVTASGSVTITGYEL